MEVTTCADEAGQGREAVILPSRQHNALKLMKILFHPASGRWGNQVAFQSRYGQAMRNYCVPRNRRTPAQQHARGIFGHNSSTWGPGLSQEQRDRWNVAGPQVMSHPRCGQRGPLTGEQFYASINSVLGCVGLPALTEPPARVIFQLSPVRGLVATNDGGGARLLLKLAASPTEDIMVFGQAPCSAGRSKRRNVSYLGLLPLPVDGMSNIIDIYKAKFGEPRPGTKVFIVTCQQKNGWKGFDQESSAIVPDQPEGSQASAEVVNSQKPLMHKGCTRDVEGGGALPIPDSQGGAGLVVPVVEAAKSASGGGELAVGGLGASG